MTLGERFRAQHHHRQAADGWHQRAELAEDDEGEPGQQDRCRDGGPYAQHPGAGAGRVDIGHRPVPEMGVRVLPRQAMDKRACQRFPLLGQGLAARPHLPERCLKRGQPGRIRPGRGAAQGPDARTGAAQFVAEVIAFGRDGGSSASS